MKKEIQHNKRGFTLIEGLVALFIFSLMALTFYSAFTVGMVRILDAQKRLQAMTLATEQMEKIRNLAYEDVGFEDGVPACVTHCVLAPDEEKSLGGGIFFVETGIEYRDDPMDGTLAGHSDVVPTDYKRVLVRVEWGGRGAEQRVEMTSRFVPPGIEQGIPNTGALSVNVSDHTGTPVADVRVDITGIAGNFFTDDTGNLFLLGMPVSAVGYPLQLTKSGYETLTTLPFPPIGAFPPKNPPIVVADGAINVGNFDLNPLTDVAFAVEDQFGSSLSDVSVLISGGRRLDNNPTPTNYEYVSDEHISNGSGEITLSDRSGGSYTFTLSGEMAENYSLWRVHLAGEEDGSYSAIALPYGGDVTGKIVVVDRLIPGIWATVVDQVSGNPLPGATVRITGNEGSYEENQLANAEGVVYFSSESGKIIAGSSYDVHVTLDGYQSSDETVVPAGLTSVVITLDAE